jgi:choline-sulfatase
MKIYLILLFVFASGLVAKAADPADRPNIIFLLADDQTTSVLGCYGHPFVQTPQIDALAARGTRFQNAFVSQSICWVSRTTLLTGLTGRSCGTPDNPEQTRPDVAKTLYSDVLRDQGYRTGFFGKWHAKMPQGYQPKEHFDVFEDISRNPYFKVQPDGSLRHETDLIVDRGIEFVKQNPKNQPFSLNLWFNACHGEDGDRRPGIGHFPWPQSADDLYEEMQMPRPRIDDPAVFEGLPEFLQTSITRERYFWRWNTEQKYQTNMRSYLRMVSGIDNAMGRLMAALQQADLADKTIIVYSADNGYHMANRGLTGKWSHFEESLRVPLIIADPRVPEGKRGQVVDALAMNLDIPATILDCAGISVPKHYQGRSLMPILTDKKPTDWRTETFHEHFAVRNQIPAYEGVRTERFKYARYFDHGPYEFLHDLENDPDELVNLASNPAYAESLNSIRNQTASFVSKYGQELDPLEGGFQASTVPYPIASAAVSIKPGADGFVSLFNGRNLSGWSGDAKYWSVEDGSLTGKTDGTLKANRFITWTGSTIRNFDLQVKVKVTRGGNSGLQYRGTSRPDLGLDIVTGYQCDIVAGNPRFNGMLYEEKGRRILSHTGEKVIVAPNGRPWIVGKISIKEFEADQWHDYRVLVEGNHHRHWIDGHPTADLIDFDEKGRSLEGVLAVQVHVGPAMKIQFKDFKIKHLPDELPLLKLEEHPIPIGSLGVKPQGEPIQTWQAPRYQESSSVLTEFCDHW